MSQRFDSCNGWKHGHTGLLSFTAFSLVPRPKNLRLGSVELRVRCGGLEAPSYSELQITKYSSITSCRACTHQAKVVNFSAVPSTLSSSLVDKSLFVPRDEIVELQRCSPRANCWLRNYCAARLQAARSSRATSSSLQLDYLTAWDHKRLSWRCPYRVVNEWSVYDSIVKKVIIRNRYLRRANYKQGSSESQKKILGCPSKKHSYDNRTACMQST